MCKNILLILFLSVLLIAPNFSLADTSADIQTKIQSIMAQIKVLQDQLTQLRAQQGGGAQWCYTFNTNLKIGNEGISGERGVDDVGSLQTALQKEGFSISNDELAQRGGTEAFYSVPARFGESTAAAVTGFQEKYRDEILTPAGLKNGTGYVGKSTRAKMNQLYGCGGQSTTAPYINSISPQSGPVGTNVTLTGSGFLTPPPCAVGYLCPAGNSVNFGPTVIRSVASDGKTITFTVPTGFETRGWDTTGFSPLQPDTYDVSISNADGTSNTVKFTVTASSTSGVLQVLSPNGGEQWAVGSTHTITWSASSSVKAVNITLGNYYSCWDAFPSCLTPAMQTTVATNIPNSGSSGSYSWTIPTNISAGSYKIIVSDANVNNASSNSSNAAFTITAATVGFCDYAFPPAGCSWQGGSSYPICGATLVCNSTSTRDKLIVSVNSGTPIAANIPAGSTGQVIGAFKFSAPAQSQITISQVTLVDYVNSNPAVSADLKNFSLWDGGAQIGQTVPATATPPSGTTLGSMNFYNLNWVIPVGSSKVLTVKADVSSTAAGNRHAIQLGGFGYAEPNISNNWASNGPFTAPSFNIVPVSACPSTYSAVVTLVPSTVAPNVTGTAKIVLNGSNPGGFAITLSGAATGQTNTLIWNNYNGNSCSAYYEVPFTAGQTSGAVNASLNFVGVVGSANLTVMSSATSNTESSALVASMAAMLNQMQEILKNMAR